MNFLIISEQEWSSEQLWSCLNQNPLSQDSVTELVSIYKFCKKNLHFSIFNTVRENVENIKNQRLHLRKQIDQAEFGRVVAIGELTYRQVTLPNSIEPIFLANMPQIPANKIKNKDQNNESNQLEEKQVKDTSKDSEFSSYSNIKTNGMENTPIMRIFNSPLSLDELHSNFKKLKIKWHPDVSSCGEKEANERFSWLLDAYNAISTNWDRFNPKNQNIPKERVEKLMNQRYDYDPDTW